MNVEERAALGRRASFRKLKPGPGLPAEAVAADQRRRIHAALIEMVSAVGLAAVTVRGLAEWAGVSTRAFYQQHGNLEDCVGDVFDATILPALGEMAAGDGAGDPEERLRVGIASFMQSVASRPRASSFSLVDATVAGPEVRARTSAATRTLEEILAELMGSAGRPGVPRRLTMGMAAGLIRVARETTLKDRAAELPGLGFGIGDWMLSLCREGPPIVAARSSSSTARREADPFPDDPVSAARDDRDERARILRATLRLALADGFEGVTVARIRAASGVSRRGFDAEFGGAVDCLLDAIDRSATEATGKAARWAAREDDAVRRTYRLSLALCAIGARQERLADLILVQIVKPGRVGLLRRERLIGRGAMTMTSLPVRGDSPDLAAEASVAAAWRIAGVEVALGRARRLPESAPLLGRLLLAPTILA